jgi:hypothetical protein
MLIVASRPHTTVLMAIDVVVPAGIDLPSRTRSVEASQPSSPTLTTKSSSGSGRVHSRSKAMPYWSRCCAPYRPR